MTALNPYITFDGDAEQAMTFYQSVLGGELTTSTFGEFGLSDDPSVAGKLMHAQLLTEGGLTLMGADTPPGMDRVVGTHISVSLSGDDVDQLRAWFDGLSAGGRVDEPFAQAPWGDTFGMVTDRFGIHWMVNAAAG